MTGERAPLKLVETGQDEAYRLQEQVGFVLRKAHQRHVAIFASRIADLTPPQFAALAVIGTGLFGFALARFRATIGTMA